jgi:predicted dehydrogenase
MNRREFLQRGTAGIVAASSVAARTSRLFADEASRPVKIGMIGAGNRGTYLMSVLLGLPGVRVTAVCDLDATRVEQAAATVRQRQGQAPATFSGDPDAYRRLLEREDVDGVIIATPTKYHCPMAIDAMNAGKHVGSEVPAGFELDELHTLVKAKEKTGRRYMLLENYVYSRRNLMIYNLARRGRFGDPYYAECSYIHDCRFMLFKPDGSYDWWGQWVLDHYGNDYPTHAIGPVSKWIGLNDGDRMEYCCSMMSAPRVLKKYAAKRFGADSPQARTHYAQGELTATLIHTASGRLIRVDYDCNSPRPMSIYYLLQGTEGIYDSRNGTFFEGEPEQWSDADRHLDEHDHHYWRRDGERATQSGHGGGDYFVMRDFTDMVRHDREPWIDVYDAASWSVLYHCSKQSIDRRGASVDIPDFTSGRWKKPGWRAAARPADDRT